MAKSKRIEIGNANSGIIIEYIKSRKVLYIRGYYDHCVGMQGKEILLSDFIKELGIDLLKGV